MMERRKNLNDKFGFTVVMKYNLLKDIAEITMGQSPDSLSYNNVKRGLPFYQGNADFGELYPIAKTWCDAPKKTAKKNDILISVRAPIGAINYTSELCCIGRGLAAITVEDDIDRNYIYYFLKAKNSELINQGTGSTFKAIGRPVLEMLKVPAISEKQKILIIKSMDFLVDIIKLRKKELILLDELIKARFIEMFGDPKDNQLCWKKYIFKDVCTVRQGLQISISKRLKLHEDNSYEYITIQSLHGAKEKEYIKNPSSNVLCTKDDILMTRTGNTGMVITDVEGVFHNNFFLIDFDRIKFNKIFLSEYLKLDYIQAEILRRAGTSTIPDLNHGEFYKIPIYEPPIELQQQFADFVRHVDKSREAVKKSLEKTQQLYDSLMQEYFG